MTPVTITMKDGRTITQLYEKVRNSPGHPMSRDELMDKFRSCLARALKGEGLERRSAALESIEATLAVKTMVDELAA